MYDNMRSKSGFKSEYKPVTVDITLRSRNPGKLSMGLLYDIETPGGERLRGSSGNDTWRESLSHSAN